MIENKEFNKCRYCGKYVECSTRLSKKERRPRPRTGKFHYPVCYRKYKTMMLKSLGYKKTTIKGRGVWLEMVDEEGKA